MEIKGILQRKVSDTSGVSQASGNKWRTQEWLVLVPGMRTKYVVLRVRTPDRCDQWDKFFEGMPDKNAPVNIKFEIDAHEYQGRWFNEVEAWDISVASGW